MVRAQGTRTLHAVITLGAIFVTATALAEQPSPQAVARWRELCEYDSYCSNLRNSDGSFKQPKRAILATLDALSDDIAEAARLYNVDARAIAGSILAENSLNVQIDDGVQDLLVKIRLAPRGRFLGRQFSFGIGQLNLPAAMAAEPLAARIEGRPQRTQEQVAQELLKPVSALRYVAAVIRDAQDRYQAQGMDISGQPAILSTIYNLGQPEDRARQARATGRAPRQNYFGFFVRENLAAIERTISYRAPGTVTAAGPSPRPSAAAPRAATASSQVPTPVLRRALDLRSAPSSCLTEGSGNSGLYARTQTLTEYGTVGRTVQGERFTVLSPGIDCDLEDWSLIRTDSGAIGWIKDSILEANTEVASRSPVSCRTPESASCLASISKVTDLTRLSSDSENGLTYLKLVGAKEQVDWHQSNVHCDLNAQMGGTGPMTDEQVQVTLNAIRTFKQRVVSQLGLTSWDTNANPYQIVLDPLRAYNVELNLTSCLPVGDSPKTHACIGSGDALVAALSGLSVVSQPSFTHLQSAVQSMASISGRIYVTPYVAPVPSGVPTSERERSLRNSRRDALAACVPVAAAFPSSKERIDRILQAIDDLSTASQLFNRGYDNNFQMLKDDCEKIADLLAPPGTEASARVAQRNQSCPSCGYTVNILSSNGSATISTVSEVTLRAMLQTDEDKDAYLVGMLTRHVPDYMMSPQQSYGFLGQSSDGADCSYDPFRTARLIEGLLAKPCVKTIYVPDRWLLKQLPRFGRRLLYRAFEEDDRFAIETATTSCVAGQRRGP